MNTAHCIPECVWDGWSAQTNGLFTYSDSDGSLPRSKMVKVIQPQISVAISYGLLRSGGITNKKRMNHIRALVHHIDPDEYRICTQEMELYVWNRKYDNWSLGSHRLPIKCEQKCDEARMMIWATKLGFLFMRSFSLRRYQHLIYSRSSCCWPVALPVPVLSVVCCWPNSPSRQTKEMISERWKEANFQLTAEKKTVRTKFSAFLGFASPRYGELDMFSRYGSISAYVHTSKKWTNENVVAT